MKQLSSFILASITILILFSFIQKVETYYLTIKIKELQTLTMIIKNAIRY